MIENPLVFSTYNKHSVTGKFPPFCNCDVLNLHDTVPMLDVLSIQKTPEWPVNVTVSVADCLYSTPGWLRRIRFLI